MSDVPMRLAVLAGQIQGIAGEIGRDQTAKEFEAWIASVTPTTVWKCAARNSNLGANDPADCGWPTCGCDPYANKVIEALAERAATSLEEAGR